MTSFSPSAAPQRCKEAEGARRVLGGTSRPFSGFVFPGGIMATMALPKGSHACQGPLMR